MTVRTRHKPPVAPGLAARKTLVLVGLMGAGKSSVGRRLAARLGLPFTDADHEIEAAAGMTIEEIFARHGEPAFRDGERRVIARLLDNPVHVLATGGGAFMDTRTRALIHERAISIWLHAELDELVRRVSRRTDRPLLKGGDPRAVLERLIAERYPIYAEADVTVPSSIGSAEETVDRIMERLAALPSDDAGGEPPGDPA
ncbi:MAG: shikimate kinase [Alphaproteobacteria bacterium]|nr:shikimate kinase [Alphaproteobacteria bacterium]